MDATNPLTIDIEEIARAFYESAEPFDENDERSTWDYVSGFDIDKQRWHGAAREHLRRVRAFAVMMLCSCEYSEVARVYQCLRCREIAAIDAALANKEDPPRARR